MASGSLLFALPAAAVSVTITSQKFTESELVQAQTAHAAHLSGAHKAFVEDFEGYPAWGGEVGTPNETGSDAGTLFGRSSKPGSGGTAVDGGNGVEIRADRHPRVSGSYSALSGRFNTSIGGANWLDSNDMEEMAWNVNNSGRLGLFDKLIFNLIDVGDIRGTDFFIEISGDGLETATQRISRQQNGSINLVSILFDEAVDKATLRLVSAHNDGFGIDDVAVARMTAPVPLPAAVWLMFGALGGLGLLSRQKMA